MQRGGGAVTATKSLEHELQSLKELLEMVGARLDTLSGQTVANRQKLRLIRAELLGLADALAEVADGEARVADLR
jgi:hypothetical protein